MNKKIDEIMSLLSTLNLLEASELVKKIEETYSVTASSPVMAVSSVANTSPVAEAVEEKTEFKLFLSEVPADKKIAILKVVRTITGLGLKEAKDLVEAAPKIIQEGMTKDASESAKKQLEEAGAKVILK